MEDAAKAESVESQEYMLDYYKTAADYENSAEAQYKVAEYYDQCYLKKRREEEAEDAKANDALEKAITYYAKAANQGYQPAVRQLFERLSECGRMEDAAAWIQKLAESGDAEAQFEIGNCYAQGNGVEQSMSDAIEWYCKAAEQGHADAQYNLGVFYGNGLAADMNQAVKWYQKAAEQGHADAQYCLAKYYMLVASATMSAKDKVQAIEWYRKAMKQGHLDAQKELGDYYYNMAKKYKAAFFLSDEMIGYYIKMFIVLGITLIVAWFEKPFSSGSAMILGQYKKPFAFIFDLFCIVVGFLVKQESFKNTEDYRTMMDYLCEAVSLGHKAAKREYTLWG